MIFNEHSKFSYTVVVAIVSAVTFIYTSFASISYVDKKHNEAIEIIKSDKEELKTSLVRIENCLKDIDKKLWELKQGE